MQNNKKNCGARSRDRVRGSVGQGIGIGSGGVNRVGIGSGHMVRNKLHWDTNDAVGLPKQKELLPVQPDFPLFWKSHCVICVPV